jgi:hypothetical protein
VSRAKAAREGLVLVRSITNARCTALLFVRRCHVKGHTLAVCNTLTHAVDHGFEGLFSDSTDFLGTSRKLPVNANVIQRQMFFVGTFADAFS